MSEQGPAALRRSMVPGNRLGPVVVQPATPEQIVSVRERLRRIHLTAAERGLAPVYVAGAVFLAADILRCAADPAVVRELQATLGVDVGDHDAIVATATRWISEVMASRPEAVA